MFSYRSQVELGRKVRITYIMSSDWAILQSSQNWHRAFCTEGAFILNSIPNYVFDEDF